MDADADMDGQANPSSRLNPYTPANDDALDLTAAKPIYNSL